ncbi:MAG: hypothetical protein RMI04_09455 [Thermofilaceae archaeon]|nr:hypothetical protein [Thermofilaceae archaeon]
MFKRRDAVQQQQPQPQQPQHPSTYFLLQPQVAQLLLEDDRRIREEVVGRLPYVEASSEIKLAVLENDAMLEGQIFSHLASLLEVKALGMENALRVPPSLANMIFYSALTRSIKGLTFFAIATGSQRR